MGHRTRLKRERKQPTIVSPAQPQAPSHQVNGSPSPWQTMAERLAGTCTGLAVGINRQLDLREQAGHLPPRLTKRNDRRMSFRGARLVARAFPLEPGDGLVEQVKLTMDGIGEQASKLVARWYRKSGRRADARWAIARAIHEAGRGAGVAHLEAPDGSMRMRFVVAPPPPFLQGDPLPIVAVELLLVVGYLE